jgi:hypothetical protein
MKRVKYRNAQSENIAHLRYHLNKQGETPENMGRKLAALVIGE